MALRVRAWPLELVNGAPLDPAATAEHVRELAEVAPDLFSGFDPDHFPTTTLPALAVAAAAYRMNTAVGEAVSVAFRDALFEEGRDISRPDVVAGVAEAFGVTRRPDDPDLVVADWRGGQTRGVKGSPHFFCGDVDRFCPSLEITRDEAGQVHVVRDTEGLERFLEQCFNP